MSAAGRLWRRAPAWRLALLSAIALTGLASMFPPALPPLHWPGSVARRAGPDRVSYVRQKDPVPPDTGALIGMPPLGQARTGLIPFAGRTLPLPMGQWQTVVLVSAPGDQQQLLLGRVVDHRLTGLMLVGATGIFGGSAGPIGVPPLCADDRRLAGAIVPSLPGQSPLRQECWAIVPMDMKAITPDSDAIVSRGLRRFGELGVAVPDKMLATQFVRSTERGWQATLVMVPDAGGTITALSAWAGRYQALLHKGFDGTVTDADLTGAAVSIP